MPQPRKPWAGFIFMERWVQLLQNPLVTREALRVLGAILHEIRWNNRARIKVREIAESLGILQSSASRGLGVLLEREIIRRVDPWTYELHPELFHAGSLERAGKRQRVRVAQDARTSQQREA